MKNAKLTRTALPFLLSVAAILLGTLSAFSDLRERDEVRLSASVRLHPVYEVEAFGATTIADDLRVE